MIFTDKIKSNYRYLRIILLFTALLTGAAAAAAQESPAENSNSNKAAAAPAGVPTPLPVAAVITEADAALKKTENIKNSLKESPGIAVIQNDLPQLKSEIDARITETSQLLSARPSLETLRTVEQEWQAIAKKIPAWKDNIRSQIGVYEGQIKELKELRELWRRTLDSLTKPTANDSNSNTEVNSGSSADALQVVEIPREVVEKIERVLRSIDETQTLVEKQQSALLTLQARVIKEQTRINETLASIANVREEALSQLFVRDSPAIWNAARRTDSAASISRETSDSLSQQAAALGIYISRQTERFILHAFIFLVFVFILFRFRRKMRPWIEDEPRLERAFTVFRLPFISGLILSIMLSSWLYPQAPRTLSAVLGALALVPGVVFLRRVLDRPFFPILYAMVVFYFVDQLRAITATLPLVTRVLFLLEILGVIIFLIWFLRSKWLSQKIPVSHHRIFTVLKKAIPFVLGAFSLAFLANVLGFVSLSAVIGNGVLGSAYLALVLYAALQIVESLIIFLLRVKPISTLYMIREHRALIEHKILTVLKWAAAIIWFVLTLGLFSVSQTIFSTLKNIVAAELAIGSIAISLGDILIFLITVWLAFALSKLIRFILDEDVYPRINLAGGVPYAISTMLHYVLLLGGFFLALAALGIDLTKFAILAGAFGVGLGFGLQNIVNNFVSGIILLFERPVKVDDLVQIGTHQGVLNQIGLRASILRTVEGSEVIVPNGQLISEEVTNWTFSDHRRRIEINVGVAYGTDPRRVIELLTAVAEAHPDVLTDPAPQALFLEFGDSSLDFQLRAWTDNSDVWVRMRSDLSVSIYEVLNENDIEIPFPQRDLNIRRYDLQKDEPSNEEN